jgi:alpha-amylase/alpha-mannosidase (GH57 family)
VGAPETLKRYLCVHGHFYQPPRENPWLEDVEVQDSAHPFHNWNERITFESYAPNTASRVLDGEGRIVDILNNYRQISFNFGPTLLSWFERRTPEVHKAIVEADKLSVKDRSGHGNALAQVYNHIIMPLASRRDKITQVRWGLKDFERRFGRKAEGMWLAETAVDGETLEILADHGVAFTILSPSQARRIKPLGKGGEWMDMDGGRIDPSRAYKWTSPNGKSISLFFYDAPISRAVAFEGLLNSGEIFANRLLQGFSPDRPHPQLVNIATDGESYGHHHRFGDMALAHALRKIKDEKLATLTNYGEYLALHPPAWEVEIIENSAWSCAHGVERWNSDCGCRIGAHPGWKQSWRGPLRRALNDLRDGLDALYEKNADDMLKDPWAARDAYIDVVLERSPEKLEAFFQAHQARPLEKGARSAALKLLEMQRQRLLMFTSCAWFFDEISGIETVAVLQFAARAIQLAQDHGEALALEQAFLSALAEAPSNIAALGNGENVYRRFVTPVITDLPRIAAHEAIENLFRDRSASESSLYCFHVKHLEFDRLSGGGNTLAIGRLRAVSLLTEETFETSYAALHLGGHEIHCVLKKFQDPSRYAEVKDSLMGRFTHGSLPEVLGLLYRAFDDHVYTLQDLLLEERRRLLTSLIRDILGRYDPLYRGLVEENRRLIEVILSVGMPVPEAFRLALEYVLREDLDRCLESYRNDTPTARKLLALREDSDRFTVPLDWEKAARQLRHRLENHMRSLYEGFSRPDVTDLLALLDLSRELRLPMNLWRLENMFYELSKNGLRELQGEDLILASTLGERLRFRPLIPVAGTAASTSA